MLNLLSCVIGGIGIYAGGALRDAQVDMSRMFLFVFAMIGVCATLLFLLKPKPRFAPDADVARVG
jgi:F0F1-type ATP synthase assembly protein I